MSASGSCSSPTSDLSHLLEYAAAAAAAVDVPAGDLTANDAAAVSKGPDENPTSSDQALDADAVARKKEADEKAARVAQDVSEFQAKLLEFTITQNSKAAANERTGDSSSTASTPPSTGGSALAAQPPPPYRGPPPPYPGTASTPGQPSSSPVGGPGSNQSSIHGPSPMAVSQQQQVPFSYCFCLFFSIFHFSLTSDLTLFLLTFSMGS